ncbi:MAG: hypothetical protein U1E46_14905 [Hyphomicrobiales bacterium]
MNDHYERLEREELQRRISEGRGNARDFDRVIQLDDIARARTMWITDQRR